MDPIHSHDDGVWFHHVITSRGISPLGKLRFQFAIPSSARPAIVKNYSDKFLVSSLITVNVILLFIQ